MALTPVCIVGATATGKTALAVKLARALGDAELLSLDAMAVYRSLDIGTAKPTADERTGLVWHGIDLVDPDEEFTVAAFRRIAAASLAGIAARHRRTILVGGTGLYQRAVVDELDIPPRYPELAAQLELRADRDGTEALFRELERLDPLGASRVHPTNRRRLVRALEVTLGSGRPFSSFGPGLGTYPPARYLSIGLRLARAELDSRIARRIEAQLAAGLLEEVEILAARPGGISRSARQALGYRELLEYYGGAQDLPAALELFAQRTRAFARRQESWFRRDPRIVWLEADAPDLLETVLGLVRRADRAEGGVARE